MAGGEGIGVGGSGECGGDNKGVLISMLVLTGVVGDITSSPLFGGLEGRLEVGGLFESGGFDVSSGVGVGGK